MLFYTKTQTQMHTMTHSHHNSQCSDTVIGGRHVSLTRLLVNCICECFQALHVILRAREHRETDCRVWLTHARSCPLSQHLLLVGRQYHRPLSQHKWSILILLTDLINQQIVSGLLHTDGCLPRGDQGHFYYLRFYLFDITSLSRPQITLQHLGLVKDSPDIISQAANWYRTTDSDFNRIARRCPQWQLTTKHSRALFYLEISIFMTGRPSKAGCHNTSPVDLAHLNEIQLLLILLITPEPEISQYLLWIMAS